MFDRKGITCARVGYRSFFNYTITPMDMRSVENLQYAAILERELLKTPAFYKGEFYAEQVGDTFLRVHGFAKGFVLINGKNIGRYYTAAGPQKTLFVPACYIKQGVNEIVVFDSDGAKELNAELVSSPDLGETER
jgi:beta-galactosidase